MLYDSKQEVWFNVSIALSWQPRGTASSGRQSSKKSGKTDDALSKNSEFHDKLLKLLKKEDRAYYFGVFQVKDGLASSADEKTHLEVAAFRHVKDKADPEKRLYW